MPYATIIDYDKNIFNYIDYFNKVDLQVEVQIKLFLLLIR